MYGYVLQVFKKDRRRKSGERLVEELKYPNFSGHAMMEEIGYLKMTRYRSVDGWRLDFTTLGD